MGDRRNGAGRRAEDYIRDFYPWRIRLWNESSRAAVLSLAARGAVRELYDELWMRSGRIQNDDRILWRLSKANCIEEWQGVKDEAMTMFEISEDGKWITCQRITEEIERAVQVLENRRKGWSERRKKSDSKQNDVSMTSESSHVTVDSRQKTEDKKEKEKRIARPSLADVVAYCQERGNHVDPQKWFDHYSSNGWKVGRNSMSDWKAAVRTWENNDYGNGNGKPDKASEFRSRAIREVLGPDVEAD